MLEKSDDKRFGIEKYNEDPLGPTLKDTWDIFDAPLAPHLCKGKKWLIDIYFIVDCYMFLYNQPSNAQTFELDVRTSIEKW